MVKGTEEPQFASLSTTLAFASTTLRYFCYLALISVLWKFQGGGQGQLAPYISALVWGGVEIFFITNSNYEQFEAVNTFDGTTQNNSVAMRLLYILC